MNKVEYQNRFSQLIDPDLITDLEIMIRNSSFPEVNRSLTRQEYYKTIQQPRDFTKPIEDTLI